MPVPCIMNARNIKAQGPSTLESELHEGTTAAKDNKDIFIGRLLCSLYYTYSVLYTGKDGYVLKAYSMFELLSCDVFSHFRGIYNNDFEGSGSSVYFGRRLGSSSWYHGTFYMLTISSA